MVTDAVTKGNPWSSDPDPSTFTVEVNGRSVQYASLGNEPSAILLPGAATIWITVRQAVSAAQQHAVLATVDRVGLSESAHVIGNSPSSREKPR